MKQLSTLLLAFSLMMATTTSSAQFRNRENQKTFEKVRERTLPAARPFKIKEAQKVTRLKNTAVMQHPTSSKHFNWTGEDWYFHQEKSYDAQGREVAMVSGLSKTITEYDDMANIVTKWYQQKEGEEAPWITTMKEITRFSDDWINETWELVDGELIITGGSKSTSWESTEGNSITEQQESWIYNPVLEAYEMTSGYKDETLVNNLDQTLSVNGSFWEDGEWKNVHQ